MATSAAVKCVWNVIPVDMYLVLGAFYFLFFEACTGAGPADTAKFKLKYKSLQSASTLTKAGTTRGHDICLTCRSIHFHSSEYENNSQL